MKTDEQQKCDICDGTGWIEGVGYCKRCDGEGSVVIDPVETLSPSTKTTLAEFSKFMVERFNDYVNHEIVVYHGPKGAERGLVEWTINCLSNPDCAYTDFVLEQIMKKRGFDIKTS